MKLVRTQSYIRESDSRFKKYTTETAHVETAEGVVVRALKPSEIPTMVCDLGTGGPQPIEALQMDRPTLIVSSVGN
jgi:hypothetical protein